MLPAYIRAAIGSDGLLDHLGAIRQIDQDVRNLPPFLVVDRNARENMINFSSRLSWQLKLNARIADVHTGSRCIRIFGSHERSVDSPQALELFYAVLEFLNSLKILSYLCLRTADARRYPEIAQADPAY